MNQLQQLTSIRRSTRNTGTKGRSLGTVAVFTAFIIGAALLFLLVFGDRLRPRISVTVASTMLVEGDTTTDAVSTRGPETVIAQASGWIEPDPYPIRVPVKIDGFVESVHALEGESVRAGELVATLDASNATYRLQSLEARWEEATAERDVLVHESAAATTAVRQAEAALASAASRFAEAEDRHRRIQMLNDEDVAPVERIAAARAETEARALLTKAETALELARISVATAHATVTRQHSRIAALDAERNQARLDVGRTKIYAPMDGVVLKRHAAPGMKRMAGMDDMDSATMVTLYDPSKLQVRVDVPLSDAGKIEPGMPARATTAALAGHTFSGRVSRMTGEADLTRNTLQVKVALEHPDPRLRPEMLCRVEFLGGSQSGRVSEGGSRILWVNETALLSESGNVAEVWVIDPINETASRREIRIGAERRDGWRRVLEGLRAGEKTVVQGADRLRPGALVEMKSGDEE